MEPKELLKIIENRLEKLLVWSTPRTFQNYVIQPTISIQALKKLLNEIDLQSTGELIESKRAQSFFLHTSDDLG